MTLKQVLGEYLSGVAVGKRSDQLLIRITEWLLAKARNLICFRWGVCLFVCFWLLCPPSVNIPQNLIISFTEEILVSREFSLFPLSSTGIGCGKLTGRNKINPSQAFSLTLSSQGQVSSQVIAVQGIVWEAFSSGWSWDIQVDLCQMFLFAVLMSQVS